MKKILLVCLFFITLKANSLDIDYKGSMGLDYKKFNYDIPFVDDKTQKTFLGQIELKKLFDNSEVFLKVEALKDFDDENRKYSKVNEVFFKYESDNYDLKIGKDIKYWGALELHNLTDIYNEKNTQNDMFDESSKLGTKAITYNYYLQNEDSISLIISEDKNEKNNISSYIKYSGSRDDIASRDFAYILNSKDEKFLMFHTLIVNDSIYKLEYLYKNKTKKYQAGIGIEHTLYGLINKKDLSLLLEYYKSNETINSYKNKIFLASRLTFNDVSSSDLTIGLIKDNTLDEYSKSVEYNTRLYDKFKIKLSYLKNDSLAIFGINIAYHF